MWSAPILNSMRQNGVRKAVAQRQIFTRADTKAEIFPEFKDDPGGFSSQILGIDLWEVQLEIALSVRDNAKTAVSACYSSGKTLLAAVLTLWWLFTRTPAMVVSTAPTDKQVRELLWYEIDRLHSEAKRRLGGKIQTKRARIDKNRRGLGFVGNKANSSSGVHAPENVLFIEDESAGIEAKVSAGFAGVTSSPNSRHLRIGNPMCDDGPFWDCFNNPVVAALWKQFFISAFDTPNVKLCLSEAPEDSGKELHQRLIAAHNARVDKDCGVVVKGLCTPKWVAEQIAELGTKHPNYIRRVLGRFWLQMDGSKVITPDLIKLGTDRWNSDEFLGDLSVCDVLAVDVAVGGADDTVLYKRCGRVTDFVDKWHPPKGSNDKWQALKIIEWCVQLKPKRLVIDWTGTGRGVGNRVQEFKDDNHAALRDVEICLVNLGEKAFSDQYDRQSDEIAFAGRRALESDNPQAVALNPNDANLLKQLLWRSFITNAKTQTLSVDSKRTLMELFSDSPDNADAWNLLFYRTKQEIEAKKNPPKALVL